MWLGLALFSLLDFSVFHQNDKAKLTHPADITTGNYQTWTSSAKEVDVVIIGGGVSGLNAAKTLLDNNFTDFIILEADNRVGGRVRTFREGDILVEDGAEWIHGNEANPLHRLAKRLDSLSEPYAPYWKREHQVITNVGKRVSGSVWELMEYFLYEDHEDLPQYYNRSMGQYYLDRFPGIYGEGWNTTLGKAWLQLMEMMVNIEMGSNSWMDVSARDFEQFIDYEEDDHQWKAGYNRLIDYFKELIPEEVIHISSPVGKIYWDNDDADGSESKVLLVADNGRKSYLAKHIIFTASVGHLKERHRMLFQPPLPTPMIKNLENVGLNLADKIMIGWPEPWWRYDDPIFFFFLWTNMTLPKDMEWLYGIAATFTVHQQPNVLEVFVTGDRAKQMESMAEDVVKDHLVQFMEAASGVQVPEPTFFRRTQWGLDPWYRGSYCSYISLEGEASGLHRRQQLTDPLKNSKGQQVILWAGEHTHNNRYSTVDGAMETGEREAKRLLSIIG